MEKTRNQSTVPVAPASVVEIDRNYEHLCLPPPRNLELQAGDLEVVALDPQLQLDGSFPFYDTTLTFNHTAE